jgi:outer membrane autotransporter protein
LEGGGGGGFHGAGGMASRSTGGGGGGGWLGAGGGSVRGVSGPAGGGGGGLEANGGDATAGTGGSGGGSQGGDGGSDGQSGQDGLAYGGGGGIGRNGSSAGSGGDFGGGGGAGSGTVAANGADGGFGGGGGGGGNSQGANTNGGLGGFGGANGASTNHAGGGGDGYGGAIFVREGGVLTIRDSTASGSQVFDGEGGISFSANTGPAGESSGAGLYLHDHVEVRIGATAGAPDVTWTDEISGTGGIGVDGGGRLVLDGTHDYTGPTRVYDGELAVNGSIVSTVIVPQSAGAIVSGSSSIPALVNHGSLNPVNSIGTLHVVTDYTQSATGQLRVEINDAGTIPGTNVDLLDVTGNAELAGKVHVLGGGGNYVLGTEYTFLAYGSRTGEFALATDDMAFFDVVLGYTASTAFFTLVESSADYAAWATTPNTMHVGTYLDGISSGATVDVQLLLDELDQVSNDEANFALEQLTGSVYGSTGQIGVQSTTLFLQALANRLRSRDTEGEGLWAAAENGSEAIRVSSTVDAPIMIVRGQCCRPTWTTWSTGFGLGGNATTDGNAAGLDFTLGGMLAGGEVVDQCNLLGFFGGYLYNYLGTDANESSKMNGGTFGSYYVRRMDTGYLLAAGGFEFDSYDSRRAIQFANLTADGETDGWKGYSYLERGATLGDRRFAIQPFGGLQYIYVRQNAFTETGAAAANLAMPGVDTHSFRSVAGARVLAEGTNRKGLSLRPEWRALWLHEFLETNSGFDTYFSEVGGSTSFAVNGLGMGRDWAVLGGGLNCDLTCQWSTYANYDLMLNEQSTFHIGSGGVQYAW